MKSRLADDASATTINRSLEIVRTILNRAPRSYGNADGHPWLEAMPPLIKARVPVRITCPPLLPTYLLDWSRLRARRGNKIFPKILPKPVLERA